MNKSALASMLGICKKAGQTVIGTEQVCDAVRKKAEWVRLTAVACDISQNTRKKLSDKCAYYGVKLIFLPLTAGELGAAVGKSGSVATVAITDAGLADAVIKKAINTSEEGE